MQRQPRWPAAKPAQFQSRRDRQGLAARVRCRAASIRGDASGNRCAALHSPPLFSLDRGRRDGGKSARAWTGCSHCCCSRCFALGRVARRRAGRAPGRGGVTIPLDPLGADERGPLPPGHRGARRQSAAGRDRSPAMAATIPAPPRRSARSREKDVTLALALAIRDALAATGRVRVALTRDDDTLSWCSRTATRSPGGSDADLFISIHADAAPANDGARGATIYTLSEVASDREAALLAARENERRPDRRRAAQRRSRRQPDPDRPRPAREHERLGRFRPPALPRGGAGLPVPAGLAPLRRLRRAEGARHALDPVRNRLSHQPRPTPPTSHSPEGRQPDRAKACAARSRPISRGGCVARPEALDRAFTAPDECCELERSARDGRYRSDRRRAASPSPHPPRRRSERRSPGSATLAREALGHAGVVVGMLGAAACSPVAASCLAALRARPALGRNPAQLRAAAADRCARHRRRAGPDLRPRAARAARSTTNFRRS